MPPTESPTAPQQAEVAAILAALRAEVRARRSAQGRLDPTPLERDLQRSLDEIELHRVVSAHWPLLGRTLPQRSVALINKLVRRYLRWYINPIVEQQNAYNDAVARALRLLAEAYIDLGEQIAESREPRANDEGRGTMGGDTSQERGARREGDTRHATRDTRHENLSTDDTAEMLTSKLKTQNSKLTPPAESTAQLQALVQTHGAAEPPAHFPDLDLSAILPQLGLREQINAHWPLVGHTPLQRSVALINKLVRRYLRWYINPIAEQLSAANAATSAALLAAVRLDAERRAETAAMRSQESGVRRRRSLTPDP